MVFTTLGQLRKTIKNYTKQGGTHLKKNGSKMVAMALAAIIAVGTSMTTVGAVSSIKSDSNQENSGISRSIDMIFHLNRIQEFSVLRALAQNIFHLT